MTKKHFRKMAYRLSTVQPIESHTFEDIVQYQRWEMCCEAVADTLAEVNPNFQRNTFLEACHRRYWRGRKAPGKGVDMDMNFDARYEQWRNRVREQFRQDHPDLAKCRHEICEDGTVFVHAGGAYPMQYTGYELWSESR